MPDTMSQTIAVTHYPEGRGHATRMLAVGRALEAAGSTVTFAGGGEGSRLIETYGYDVFEPATVDYIKEVQFGSMLDVFTGSVPNSFARIRDYLAWIETEQPLALVTDDMFAAIAASLSETPLVVLTHNSPSLYETAIEKVSTWLITKYQHRVSKTVLYPAVWPATDGDPPNISRIPPVALEPPEEPRSIPPIDVLVVPSVYSKGFGGLVDALRDDGFETVLAGGPDWVKIPALLPWIRAADVVVCSGYSTVMEAAVAGTPCIVHPFTNEQLGVAWKIEQSGLPGFQVERSIDRVIRAVRDPPKSPVYRNGIGTAVRNILEQIPVEA